MGGAGVGGAGMWAVLVWAVLVCRRAQYMVPSFFGKASIRARSPSSVSCSAAIFFASSGLSAACSGLRAGGPAVTASPSAAILASYHDSTIADEHRAEGIRFTPTMNAEASTNSTSSIAERISNYSSFQ